LVATGFSINGPYGGVTYGLKGLAVIVLGGLGDIPGAVVGGLVIGLAEAFVPSELSGYRDAIAFALLFVMLLIRPQGILGRKLIQKVWIDEQILHLEKSKSEFANQNIKLSNEIQHNKICKAKK
jgi:Branched-chain amino acid transport system / permease component